MKKMSIEKLKTKCTGEVLKDEDFLFIINNKDKDLINISLEDKVRIMYLIQQDT